MSDRGKRSDAPWPAPSVNPHLRQTRFRDVGEDVERWVWTPADERWTLESTRTRAEYEAASERIAAYAKAHPPTPEDLEHARQLAKERGWA